MVDRFVLAVVFIGGRLFRGATGRRGSGDAHSRTGAAKPSEGEGLARGREGRMPGSPAAVAAMDRILGAPKRVGGRSGGALPAGASSSAGFVVAAGDAERGAAPAVSPGAGAQDGGILGSGRKAGADPGFSGAPQLGSLGPARSSGCHFALVSPPTSAAGRGADASGDRAAIRGIAGAFAAKLSSGIRRKRVAARDLAGGDARSANRFADPMGVAKAKRGGPGARRRRFLRASLPRSASHRPRCSPFWPFWAKRGRFVRPGATGA